MIKQITREELRMMRDSGKKYILVDVLPKESYENEHIPGALSIPLADIDEKAPLLLGKNETIIVYCAHFDCTASTKAAQKLQALGYRYVLDYKGGLKDYKEGGLTLIGKLHNDPTCHSCCGCDNA